MPKVQRFTRKIKREGDEGESTPKKEPVKKKKKTSGDISVSDSIDADSQSTSSTLQPILPFLKRPLQNESP
jgi:hypothetical protein